MITPEFSFVTFDGSDDPVPYINNDAAFQVYSDEMITSVEMVNMYGMTVQSASDIILADGNTYFIHPLFESDVPDCFRLHLMNGGSILAESNTFIRTGDDKYTSRLMYRCDEDDFGFVYCPGYIANTVRLPFHLKNPQFPQTQNMYKTLSGRSRVTSASIGMEYPLETDYMTREMHQKLVIALSHDFVFVDGQLLTKTGDYTIDWDNINIENGVETAKAVCAVSANATHRNSNCGSRCAGLNFDVRPRILHVEAV
jgi:hypothetical protein